MVIKIRQILYKDDKAGKKIDIIDKLNKRAKIYSSSKN